MSSFVHEYIQTPYSLLRVYIHRHIDIRVMFAKRALKISIEAIIITAHRTGNRENVNDRATGIAPARIYIPTSLSLFISLYILYYYLHVYTRGNSFTRIARSPAPLSCDSSADFRVYEGESNELNARAEAHRFIRDQRARRV